MFGLTLRIVSEDGDVEVPVKPSTIVAFEREFQTGLGRALLAGLEGFVKQEGL